MLVTGPGPDAIHQKTNFQQDIEFLKGTNEFLVKNYGIQYLGPWHSHHLLGLREPSFVDIQSTRSTAKKNAYKKLSQFIITFEKWPQHASVFQRSQTRSWKRKARKNDYSTSEESKNLSSEAIRSEYSSGGANSHPEFVQINPFFYFNAMTDEPVKCPLKILPGISPIRLALRFDPTSSLHWRTRTFPTSRILFEPFKVFDKPNESTSALPERISKQCLRLPEDVLNSLSWIRKDDVYILCLSSPDKACTGYITYAIEFPYKLKAVYMGSDQKNGKTINLTNETLLRGDYTKLIIIYRSLVHHIEPKESREARRWWDKSWDSHNRREW